MTKDKVLESIKMGCYVEENIHHHQGFIDGIFINFWKAFPAPAVESRLWLNMQAHPFTEEQINSERWFHIKDVSGKGSFFSCESRLTLLPIPAKVLDPEKGPTEPWSLWARIVGTESVTGPTCLYLEDRVMSWRGELPVLFMDSGRFKPTAGDLIEGDETHVQIHRGNRTYRYDRNGDFLKYKTAKTSV